MGLIDTSLQIGRSAIMAQSLAMDVVGNNLANASTEGYARQEVDLRSLPTIRSGSGVYIGIGVSAESVRRVADAYLEQRLRDARSDSEDLKAQDELFQRLEGAFNELTDNDLSTMMNAFFNSLGTLQGNPEDPSLRRAVIESATTFTDTIKYLRSKLDDLRKGLDIELAGAVSTINSLTSQIASLNVEISRLEGGTAEAGAATALRDRRDLALGQLADLVDIRVVDLGNGMVNVFAGADPLVMNNSTFQLATETRVDRGVQVYDVVFADDGRPLVARGGKIAGLVEARDEGIVEFVDKLDGWVAAFVEGFNRIHASGQGTQQMSSVTGINSVSDTAAVLNAAGLDFTPETGTFEIKVKNATSGETKTFQIHVDLDGLDGDDTTLASLVQSITDSVSAVYPQVTASIGAGNTLKIASSAGELTFTFGNDTSGALAALGVNTFFTGKDSTDVGLNPAIVSRPAYIAAATTDMPGDNSNVSSLLTFQWQGIDALDGTSVDDYYQGIVTTLGIRAAEARDRHLGSDAIKAAVQGQREALSGVSLDEEAVKLIRYQSGYAAAARFISTVNEMIKVLLNM